MFLLRAAPWAASMRACFNHRLPLPALVRSRLPALILACGHSPGRLYHVPLAGELVELDAQFGYDESPQCAG